MIDSANVPLAEQLELREAREQFDESLREASGAGRNALSRVMVPAAVGAAALGLVACVLLARPSRRNLVLVQITLPASAEDARPSPSPTRVLLLSAFAAAARVIGPQVAQMLAEKAADHFGARTRADEAGRRDTRSNASN
jgi:uncharacterized protein (DUF2252 family)